MGRGALGRFSIAVRFRGLKPHLFVVISAAEPQLRLGITAADESFATVCYLLQLTPHPSIPSITHTCVSRHCNSPVLVRYSIFKAGLGPRSPAIPWNGDSPDLPMPLAQEGARSASLE